MNVPFEQVAKQYEPLLKGQIKKLRIYKEYEHYYQVGLEGLWHAYQNFDETKGTFSNFAYVTVRGYLLTELQRQHTYESRFVPANDFVLLSGFGGYVDKALEKEIIAAYLSGLSKRERLWAEEAILYQKKLSEIAAEQNVSVETVKTWRKHALRKLRKKIESGMFS